MPSSTPGFGSHVTRQYSVQLVAKSSSRGDVFQWTSSTGLFAEGHLQGHLPNRELLAFRCLASLLHLLSYLLWLHIIIGALTCIRPRSIVASHVHTISQKRMRAHGPQASLLKQSILIVRGLPRTHRYCVHVKTNSV